MNGAPEATSDEFKFQIENHGKAVVVKLTGALHMDACDPLQKELVQLVSQPASTLVLDLSELTFMCSLGLGALVAAYTQAAGKKAVRVVAPSPNIRALLEVTKLVRLFPPYDSVETAMAES